MKSVTLLVTVSLASAILFGLGVFKAATTGYQDNDEASLSTIAEVRRDGLYSARSDRAGPLQLASTQNPSQGFGANSGLYSIALGMSGNLTLDSTDPQNPLIDLRDHLVLSTTSPLAFTNTSGTTSITSSANGASSFPFYFNVIGGAPTTAFLVNASSGTPTAKLFDLQVGGQSLFGVGPSGGVSINLTDLISNGLVVTSPTSSASKARSVVRGTQNLFNVDNSTGITFAAQLASGGDFALGGHINQATAGQFATILTLSAGSKSFSFPIAYSSSPVCVATGTSNSNVLRIGAISGSSVTVSSSSGTDTQNVNLVCFGNPN